MVVHTEVEGEVVHSRPAWLHSEFQASVEYIPCQGVEGGRREGGRQKEKEGRKTGG